MAKDARPPQDGGARRLVVLQTFGALRPSSNPYLHQLVAALEPSATVRTFSWRTALFGRWDVLHVHWPETLVVRDGRARTLARALLLAVLLLRMRLTRRPLVRTLHNARPHEGRGRLVEAALRLVDRRTDAWILLNDTSPAPGGAPAVVVPHGHYGDWYAGAARPLGAEPRTLFFGLIREYKNVTGLVTAFTAVTDAAARLRVVGKPDPAELAERIRAAASGDLRVSLSFGFASDEELVAEIAAARLVVLPYRELTNSGALLLALSLGRPVLVPDNPITAALAAEVGEDWVRRYRGELGPGDLDAALAGPAPEGTPDLSRRDWAAVGAEHLRVYRAAVAASHDRRYSE